MWLMGFSTDPFRKAISACKEIHMKMGTQGTTNMWQSTLYEGHIAIYVHARYFMAYKTAPKEENLSFSEGVDPDGVLLKLHKHDQTHNQMGSTHLTLLPGDVKSNDSQNSWPTEVQDIV